MGDYYGLPTHSLENSHLRLEYLAEAGPRIVRLSLAGSQVNLLAETPDAGWDTPYGRFSLRGGHRLWHAPEAAGLSSIPDDAGLEIEEFPGGVRLTQPVELPTGIQKTIEITLSPDGPQVTLLHSLANCGASVVELAPWAITQLPLGGVVTLPQPAGLVDTHGLQPNRRLVLWPYTRWDDPRLHLGDDRLQLDAQPQQTPAKWGCLNYAGWIGYAWQDIFFCKRFTPQPACPHADMGCNAEVFMQDLFVELETLGPLVRLEPGESVMHTEVWEISRGHPVDFDQ